MTGKINEGTDICGLGRRVWFVALLFVCFLHPLAALAAYTISADGTEVTDSTTGLIWRRCAEGFAWNGSTCNAVAGTPSLYTHEAALLRAKSQATASGKAWRVPNVRELVSISKLGEAESPSIDTTAFPATPTIFFGLRRHV